KVGQAAVLLMTECCHDRHVGASDGAADFLSVERREVATGAATAHNRDYVGTRSSGLVDGRRNLEVGAVTLQPRRINRHLDPRRTTMERSHDVEHGSA